MARTANRPVRRRTSGSDQAALLKKLRIAQTRPLKADPKLSRLAKVIDGLAPLTVRVADMEQQIATLNARTTRLAHAITAVRALYVEGARALDI